MDILITYLYNGRDFTEGFPLGFMGVMKMKKMSYTVLSSLWVLSASVHAQQTQDNQHHQHQHHQHHNHGATKKVKESAVAVELSQCWGRFRTEGPSAVYLEMSNTDTKQAAYIVDVRSASFTETMLHESYEKDGMKGMRHVNEVEVPAGQKFILKPGAHHVMLFNPQGVKEGDKVAVTFTLSNGHELTTDCIMKSIAARSFND